MPTPKRRRTGARRIFGRLFGVSRSLFYRRNDDADMAVRDEICAIAADWSQYGYRTVTHELQRRGLL